MRMPASVYGACDCSVSVTPQILRSSPLSSLPIFFSSWCVRPVCHGRGQLSALCLAGDGTGCRRALSLFTGLLCEMCMLSLCASVNSIVTHLGSDLTV